MSFVEKMARFRCVGQELRRAKHVIDPGARKRGLLYVSLLATKLIDPKFGNIRTHLTRDEKNALYLLAAETRAGSVIVEVGSFLGASACYLALGLCGKGTVYCVDTWNNDAMDEPERDTFAEFEHNVRDLKAVIRPLRGSSVQIAKSFDRGIDLLFIDGDHSYENCLSDWKAWNRFLKEGAVVAFHDIGWAEGVSKVVRDCVSPQSRREVTMGNMYLAWL